jgi:hypothetical protein
MGNDIDSSIGTFSEQWIADNLGSDIDIDSWK